MFHGVGGFRTISTAHGTAVVLVLFFAMGLGYAYSQDWPDYWSPDAPQRWAALTADDIEALVASGVDVNRTDRFGWTPLMYALRYNSAVEVTEALLSAGANVHARETIPPGRTTLMVALQYAERDATIAALLVAGADVHERDFRGETALMFAALRRDSTALEMLIRAGADLEARDELGMTALMLAAHWSRNATIVRALLDAGADVHARDEIGSTPLLLSVWNTDPEVMRILLEAGARRDIDVLSRYGRTALMEAVERDADPAILTVLIDAGADVNRRGLFDETALMIASGVARNPMVIEMLLAAGADPALENSAGRTALDYARSNDALIGSEILERLAE